MPRPTAMNLLLLVMAGLLGFLIAGGSQPGRAQNPPPVAPVPVVPASGRYLGFALSNGNGMIIVLDTVTGQCWSKLSYQTGTGGWNDLGSPVPAR